MKLLILTSRFPYPLEKGDKLRAYFQIRELAKQHELVLFSLSDTKWTEDSIKALQPYCQKIHLFPLKRISIYCRLFLSLFSKTPFQVAYFYQRSLHKKLQTIIEQEAPDLIYCQLIRMAVYCQDIELPKVLDYMDAFSIGLDRRSQKERGIRRWLVKLETRRVRNFEIIAQTYFDRQSIISEGDKNHLRVPNPSHVHVIPNGIDSHFFQPQPSAEPQFDLVFVGNLGYFPNVEACSYLVKQVLPLLPRTIRLLLAGANAPQKVRAFDDGKHIRVSSWLPDIREGYQNGHIFVAPLFTGSGQQNKILEAMALELPVITTSLVNQAIGAEDGKQLLIADSPGEFVAHIQQLMGDASLRIAMGKAARSFVKETYSWEKTGERLDALLSEVADRQDV